MASLCLTQQAAS